MNMSRSEAITWLRQLQLNMEKGTVKSSEDACALAAAFLRPAIAILETNSAEDRLFDVLLDDDWQAWSEAERHLEAYRPDLYERLQAAQAQTQARLASAPKAPQAGYPALPEAAYPCGPRPYVLMKDAWAEDQMRAYYDLGFKRGEAEAIPARRLLKKAVEELEWWEEEHGCCGNDQEFLGKCGIELAKEVK